MELTGSTLGALEVRDPRITDADVVSAVSGSAGSTPGDVSTVIMDHAAISN